MFGEFPHTVITFAELFNWKLFSQSIYILRVPVCTQRSLDIANMSHSMHTENEMT